MSKSTPKIVDRKNLLPFILITSLFALWGFANDITNPMVAAFKTIMEISNFKASLVQFAFYGGYATMAIPAALFIQKYSYKKGILLGLALYATGALLFWPAAQFQVFGFFLVSLYILTFGLAFLETTANPFILSLGEKETATQRLNLAQAFNPMGSLIGMFVASRLILAALHSDKHTDEAGNLIDFSMLDATTKAMDRAHDLMVIRNPYVVIGIVVIVMLVVIAMVKMPQNEHEIKIHPLDSAKRLLGNKVYREGVIAQVFYVAAQIMCWTFIIQYAGNLGIDKATAQLYNIAAMVVFLTSRFISTFLMRFINARKLLMFFAIGGMVTTLSAILIVGVSGLYFLMATSAFMSLMFPTIYGIALRDVGEDVTLGSAGLVMAIVGGALLPPIQGAIIDLGTVGPLPAVNFSFFLPFVSFIMIAIYGYRSNKFQS
ncbi:L-fucose:H+ symporter permease [Flammeovirgaceae bacterium SG7u.111]|nr:L-fucose:H+ symporter permease [Flammeovirgaceae bacterium SG7u.132]WPO33903.1 L-fucose:H+ symporter permease [Flammeovirgaceae bacterium SG7u.111]